MSTVSNHTYDLGRQNRYYHQSRAEQSYLYDGDGLAHDPDHEAGHGAARDRAKSALPIGTRAPESIQSENNKWYNRTTGKIGGSESSQFVFYYSPIKP